MITTEIYRKEVLPHYCPGDGDLDSAANLLKQAQDSIQAKENYRETHGFGTSQGNGFANNTENLRYRYQELGRAASLFYYQVQSDQYWVNNKDRFKEFLTDLHHELDTAVFTMAYIFNSLDAIIRAEEQLEKHSALFNKTQAVQRVIKSLAKRKEAYSSLIEKILRTGQELFKKPFLNQVISALSQAFGHLAAAEQVKSAGEMIDRFSK